MIDMIWEETEFIICLVAVIMFGFYLLFVLNKPIQVIMVVSIVVIIILSVIILNQRSKGVR